MCLLALALTLVLGAGSVAATPARAADFAVNSTDDETDLVLNGLCDTPGAGVECTLRAAVQEANATGAADVIQLPNLGSDYELSLTGAGNNNALSGDLDLTQSVTIQGSGQPMIDGLGSDRVLHLGPSGSPAVTVAGVEVRGGGAVDTGAGILVDGGSLNLSSATVAGNSAESAGGTAEGGGVWIDSAGPHAITASTLSGNTADGMTGAAGGGLVLDGVGVAAGLTNSTVSGNEATSALGNAEGGGIATLGGITLTHVSIHQNTASGASPAGGSLAALGGSASFRATIVSAGAADPGSQNCASLGGNLVTLGSNLEAPTSQCGLSAGAQDRFAADAGLAPLADRGGPTQTHALLSTSGALDAIDSCFPVTSDQRAEPRPSGVACEIGSFERQVEAPPGTGCFRQVPTILGTAGGERIVGTPGPDVILAQAGKDLIKGRGGKDVICAGKGKDRAFGGASGDRIAGEDGKDRLFGQAGKDILLGNAGRDVLSGGKRRDRLNGGGRLDNCRGGVHDKLKNC